MMNIIVPALLVLLTSCATRGPAKEPAKVHARPRTPAQAVAEIPSFLEPVAKEKPDEFADSAAEYPDQLTVTTWNVKKLGRKSFDFREKKILDQFDIMTFQEVNANTTGRRALGLLRDGIEARTKRKMCWALSPKPTGEATEVYGYIWRNDRIARVLANGTVKQECESTADVIPLAQKLADAIVREPAVGKFVFKPNGREFLLVSVHLVPEEKSPEQEVQPLFPYFDQESTPLIVAGDYNLGATALGGPGDPFAYARSQGFTPALVGVATSSKKSRRDYHKQLDNFWTRGFDLTGIGRVDVFTIFNDLTIKEIYNTISDHAPVSAGFKFQ